MKRHKLEDLVEELNWIIQRLLESEEEISPVLVEGLNEHYLNSALNLIHYRRFREMDLRPIQKKLRQLGLTRLSNSEGHILASLFKVRKNVLLMLGNLSKPKLKATLSIKNSERLLNKNTKDLLGYRSKGRRLRIMVTLPREAAYDVNTVEKIIKNGTNCVRINCAHDTPDVWIKMIDNVRKIAKKTSRKVLISMDLAGPKIRTGQIVPGPQVIKLSPTKDRSGNIIEPCTIHLIDETHFKNQRNHIPVNPDWIQKIRLDDKLWLTDARGKKRKLNIVGLADDQVIVNCNSVCYVNPKSILEGKRSEIGKTKICGLTALEQFLTLHEGDSLILTNDKIPGENQECDKSGKVIKKAHISCQCQQVFECVKVGEKVLFDDGKIEGKIVETNNTFFELVITKAKVGGTKLRKNKGINFPESKLNLSSLTSKDKKDLEFIVKYADVINYSFVKKPSDVRELLHILDTLGAKDYLGIILKIETKVAYDNLSNIILEAMKGNRVGVMIARGDLAVEVGWGNIARVQSEILKLCAAGHIPVIWATQVLENLVKNGTPTRAEITDVNTALKAECIMLNKGPYLKDALKLLHGMLSELEEFQHKNRIMLPSMATA